MKKIWLCELRIKGHWYYVMGMNETFTIIEMRWIHEK